MSGRVSSYSGPMQMDSLIQAMTGRLNQLANEISSGQKTDPAGAMGSGASLLYQLHAQSDQATVLQTSVGLASQRLDTVQTVMTSIASIAQTVASAGQNAQMNGVGNISAASASSLAQQAQS